MRGRIHHGAVFNHYLWTFVHCLRVKTSQELLAADAGSQKMQEISDAIAEGAQAYLKRQYTTIAYVGGGIFVLLVILLGWWVAFGFLLGALLSAPPASSAMNVSRARQCAHRAGGDEIARRRPRHRL